MHAVASPSPQPPISATPPETSTPVAVKLFPRRSSVPDVVDAPFPSDATDDASRLEARSVSFTIQETDGTGTVRGLRP